MFQENDKEYRDITTELTQVDDSMQRVLKDQQKIVEAIELLKKFVVLAESVILTAIDVVA